MQKMLRSIKTQSNDILRFTRQIFSKWILWLFLILDVTALIIQYIAPEFRFPQYVYVVFGLIGFFWAGYKVNQELLIKYNTAIGNNTRNNVEPITSLSMTLIEGNEYNFKVFEPYNEIAASSILSKMERKEIEGHYDENGILYIEDEIFYLLPRSALSVNLRVLNDGNTPLDILNISSNCGLDMESPFMFVGADVFCEEKEINYPKHLEPREIFLCQIRHGSYCKSTPAQTAVNFRNIKNDIIHNIIIDVLDRDGNRKDIKLSSKISIRPLADLYVTQWQIYKQVDLLRLLGNSME